MMFLAGGVGAAFAATSGIAPLLVPYTVNTIAGTPQFPSNSAIIPAAGYFGENVPRDHVAYQSIQFVEPDDDPQHAV